MSRTSLRRIGGFLIALTGKLVSAALLAVASIILMIDLAIFIAWADAFPTVKKIADEMQLVVLIAAASLNLVKFSPLALGVEYVAVAFETASAGALFAAVGSSPELVLHFILSKQDWESFEIFTLASWKIVWPAHLLALVFYSIRIWNGEIRKELSNV